MKALLEAGVHFGHQTRRWNPKMAPYIYTERNGIYIIDLQKTVKKLEEAYNFVRQLSENGESLLFVGTKKQAQDAIREEATRNMINNLGATADSTHFAGSVHTLPKGYRRIFTMKRYEVEFPLKHPRYVIENVAYKKAVYRIMGWGHPWIKIGRSFEELFLNLRYGNFSIITKAIKNRINKWLKRDQHR